MNIKTSSYREFKESIKRIPVLTKEEELALTERYVETRSKDVEEKLVIHHLRFVSFIVGKYAGYSMPEDDMIQEGIKGLIEGIRKFHPKHNVRLFSYVGYDIRNHLNNYVMRNYRIFNTVTTKAQRKLFFKLKSVKHLSDAEIAVELDVPESEVRVMRERLLAKDCSDVKTNFDSQSGDKGDKTGEFLESNLPTQEDIVNDMEREAAFKEAFNTLPEREKYIISRRFLNGGDRTEHLYVIAEELGISNERVRQLSVRAIKIMKDYIQKKQEKCDEQLQAA